MGKLDYTRHYNNWHTDSREHELKMTSYYNKAVIPLFSNDKEINVLDIGCGMGFLLLALKSNNYKNIRGIDVDKGQVDSCVKKGLDVQLVDDTIKYLTDNAGSFDLVTAFDVLEHIPSEIQIDFVNAIRKSLTKEGQFICSVPNANSFLGSRNRYIDYTHYVAFTEISLDFVLYSGGFNNISIIPMDFVFFSFKPSSFIHWCLFKVSRFFRRITYIAELGVKQGRTVPISFNLIGKAKFD